MKRILLILTSLWMAVSSYALHVVATGNAIQLTNQGDTILLFAQTPEVHTLPSVGAVDWYRIPDTLSAVQQGTDYLYPEHGAGYRIKVKNHWEEFWVMDYDSLRWQLDSINVEADCQQSVLKLQGKLPQMRYITMRQIARTYPRACAIQYKDVCWANDTWTDSIVHTEEELRTTLSVGASPVVTDYGIYDPLAQALGLPVDTSYSLPIQPVALRIHPQAITTKRGDEEENEVKRPTDEGARSDVSAPLEMQFRTNGLNVDYYRWDVYRGSDLLFTRTEADHRYTFSDYGSYRVALYVSNSNDQGGVLCEDSTSFDVSITQSMIWVPNFFTPNGDGTNDEFRVAYSSLKEFHCWVYNRWGVLVFEWTDPAKGWDGTIGGRPAAAGAYYYVIRAMGTDAAKDAKYTWKPTYQNAIKKNPESILGVYQLSGAINLLR